MNSTSRTYRFIAFSLAFLMFFTSTSFGMDMHICQGKIKALGLFGEAENCYGGLGMEKGCDGQKMLAQQEGGCSMKKKDCCHNRSFQVQADQDQQVQNVDFSINKPLQHFVAVYVFVFFKNTFSVENEVPSFAYYQAPVISRDISVLFETFLI